MSLPAWLEPGALIRTWQENSRAHPCLDQQP